MTIELKDKWIWDSWYYRDGDTWHGYFLQADKSLIDPELRHWNVTQGHATSKDLINWEHQGTCFAPSTAPAWDDKTTWTGSVVRDESGTWHLFYTGTSSAEQGLKQRIGHAVSDDGHNWQRVGTGLCLDLDADSSDYEEYTPGHWHDRAMRDPWVMRDPDGEGWLMYFTARSPGVSEPNAGGAIGFATSPDLEHWTLQPPVFVGGFGQLEVPQVFQYNGQWYCLFCTADEHWSKDYTASAGSTAVTGSHYLVGESARGPWRVAPGAFLDGDLPCSRYASRIVETDEGLAILGFIHTPGGQPFVGIVSDPDAIVPDQQGLLQVCRSGDLGVKCG